MPDAGSRVTLSAVTTDGEPVAAPPDDEPVLMPLDGEPVAPGEEPPPGASPPPQAASTTSDTKSEREVFPMRRSVSTSVPRDETREIACICRGHDLAGGPAPSELRARGS